MCGHHRRSQKTSLRHGDPLARAGTEAADRDATPQVRGDFSAPTPSLRPELRISDAEREAAVVQLRDHAGEGRLDVEELSERLDGAYTARTRGDLDALLGDLPRLTPGQRQAQPAGVARPTRLGGARGSHRPRDREEALSHIATYVGVCLLLVGIWFVTGAEYFWPIWPILGWGVGVVSHTVPVLMGTASCSTRSRRRSAPAATPWPDSQNAEGRLRAALADQRGAEAASAGDKRPPCGSLGCNSRPAGRSIRTTRRSPAPIARY